MASLVAGGTGVALRADRDVTITAADLVSGGHLSIKAGRDLSLLSQAQVEHTLTARRQSFAGLKLEVSQNVTGAIDNLKSAGHTFNSGYGGDGYRAIGAISGALKTVDAVYELTHPSVSASLTAGASSSRSRSGRYAETARPTTIRAAGDVSLGAGRDLHLQGTQVDAGGWLALGAGRDVLIESARSRSAASQSSSSWQAGVGVGANVGLSGPSVGPKVEGSVSQSRSQEQGETNTNAHLNAGKGISVSSGRDTTIAGARLTAPEIDLKVGRDLTVASRQDTSQGRSRSSSIGGSLTVGKDSPSSGSLSGGQGRGSSDRAWVGEQTGIVAGDRLSVTVGGHTWIHGAVLDSGTGNLSLDTGSLTVTDVHNHDRGRSFQATVGVSGSRNPDGSTPETGPDGKPVGGTVSGSFASHDKQGLSRGTIGPGTITVSDPAHQSQDLAAINRDPKQAEVITRDRKAGVDFYGSSSAVREAASGFAGTRQGLDQLGKAARDGFKDLPARVQATVKDVAGKLDLAGRTFQDAIGAVIDGLVAKGEIPADEAEAAKKAALRAKLDDAEYAKLVSGQGCGRQGFNLHDLLFTPAHAEVASACIGMSATTAALAAGTAGAVASGATAFVIAMVVPTTGSLDQARSVTAVDGTEVKWTGESDETDRVMTLTAPDGTVQRLVFSTTQTGDAVVTGATVQGTDGIIRTLNPVEAYVVAQTCAKLLGVTVVANDNHDTSKNGQSSASTNSSTGNVTNGSNSAGSKNTPVVIDSKIRGQLADRGWTEKEIDDLVGENDPVGSTTDNRRANKTPDG